ncbi:tryptophan synthase subunit alpha [Marinospirillum alkaliphilum]|uniref:Tryptophan synthase alpha chain n=1 Tax=Marinospirillum alkaliphilum DSM 21637 TaxID=1122209 RepID=A0A1K1X5D5_9GAMM|nr:tryptophan synthase subunit alpha [Marinospirillum alkaliphilum]SFX44277.1 tryptophan synthase, alpha chain [Marinospirillum alkaliphilum DSM 21637]
MSRIQTTFATLKQQGRKALIPYITAGDPHPDYTVSLMHALVEAGADILELGVPFSDPMADGPVIQKACERALKHNTRTVDVLAMVAEFRKTNSETPVVLMGYLNPIEALGYETFVKAAALAGVDGVLVVDLPPEEAEEFSALLKAHEMDAIFLLAPTTTRERAARICAAGSGYLYYVSLKGVTGSATLDVPGVAAKLEAFAGLTDLPIAVGFGIRDGATAAALGSVSDGVIVGSALVSRIAELEASPEKIAPVLKAILGEMRQALDASVA